MAGERPGAANGCPGDGVILQATKVPAHLRRLGIGLSLCAGSPTGLPLRREAHEIILGEGGADDDGVSRWHLSIGLGTPRFQAHALRDGELGVCLGLASDFPKAVSFDARSFVSTLDLRIDANQRALPRECLIGL